MTADHTVRRLLLPGACAALELISERMYHPVTKAIFFDVDGTLVSFKTHTISPAVLEALHTLRAKGILLFLATGRHPAMLSYLNSVFSFDGYVTLSGQYCFCGDLVLHRNPMERPAVEELVSAAQSNAFSCIFLEGRDIYLNFASEYTHTFMKDLHLELPPIQDPRRALDGEVYQAITFLDRDHEHLLLDRAPHLKTTRWHPNFLDVIPSSGGKDRGMDALLDHFGLPVDQSMAFGDGENDLSMLVHAGIGVAMGSASPAVKQRADWTTASVEEDGILLALRQFDMI